MSDSQESGNPGYGPQQPNRDDLDKRIEEIKRVVSLGANEAQQRIKRVVEKANDYWQEAQTVPTPQQAANVEEEHIRKVVNMWSNDNWRVARDLGTYMDAVTWHTNEVWGVTVHTRWETRSVESATEPYTGRSVEKKAPQPLLPVWDYDLPAVTGLKPHPTHIPIDGLDELLACLTCNGTGRALCTACEGRGFLTCPECQGRVRRRCTTCRGRGYVADWGGTNQPKKPFFQKQAERVTHSLGEKVSEVFETIRQQGVPLPNPVDMDPATKGRTVPCPDCLNGEVDCSCGNGKRVCSTCSGAKAALCANCGGTGKIVSHREIARRFELRTQNQFVGETAIPAQQLLKADGDLVYNDEVNETTHPEAPPDGVPMDVWHTTVDLLTAQRQEKPDSDNAQASPHPTLQVVELLRIPYTRVQYRYSDQSYVLYLYDVPGEEKVYADVYPVRWDRVERLVKAISNDLLTPAQQDTPPDNTHQRGYGGSYNIKEETDNNG